MSEANAATGSGDGIHVALVFDDNFWAPSYATMRSICVTSGRRPDLVFHLVHTALRPDHKAKLATIADEYGVTVAFHDITDNAALRAKIDELPKVVFVNLNDIIYARIFLGDIVPDTVRRIVYIDGDILVRTRIEDFYVIDLEDKTLAAANCPHRVLFQSGRDIRPKPWFETQNDYFNSGLLLIDLEKYRALDPIALLKSRVPEADIPGLYYDQEILNIVMRDSVKILGADWNLQNPVPAHESLDPKIVHYTGDQKPWFLFTNPAFKRQYRHTMTNTVYYQFLRERLIRKAKRFFRLG